MLFQRGVCSTCRAKGFAIGKGGKLHSAARNFSSIPARGHSSRITPNVSNISRLSSHLRPSPARWFIPISSHITVLSQTRFNSTTQHVSPTTASADAPVSPTPDLTPGTAEGLQQVATPGALGAPAPLPLEDLPLVFPPEQWHIGYLRDCGLDFGWGPSSVIQTFLEHMVVYTGTSIGLSIILTAFTIRVLTFPLIKSASDTSARMKAMGPLTEPIRNKMREALARRDTMEFQRLRIENRNIMKDNKINLWKSFLPLLQIPIGFGAWRVIRNMAHVPVAGMADGGFLWFQNLTVPDPYFLLPAILGVSQHLAIRWGGETGSADQTSAKMRLIFMYFLPPFSTLVVSFIPAGVQLSFVTASCMAIVTGALLRQPNFRAWLNMAPVVKKAPAAQVQMPYQGVINVNGRVQGQAARQTVTANKSAANPRGIAGVWKRIKDAKNGVMESVTPEANTRIDQRKQDAIKQKAIEYETKRAAEIARQEQQRKPKTRKNR